jgi:DNA-binding NarL/FixJ family response regulator
VAERLFVTEAIAKIHASRMLAKLGLHDRAQLVVAAYESELIHQNRDQPLGALFITLSSVA